LRDAAAPRATGPEAPPSEPGVAPAAAPPPPEIGPLTREHLRAVWPAVVAQARTTSQFLAAVLDAAEVAGIEGDMVLLSADSVHAAGLERQRDTIAGLVGRFVREKVRIGVGGQPGAASAPARITEAGAKAERMKALRAKDPTLSAAVDALDLELLE
jgi:hypothetical protein